MLVGLTVDPRDYETRLPMLPDNKMCRVFGYASKGLPAWKPVTGDNRIARLRALLPDLIPACVFQDWLDDDSTKLRVDAWLDEVDAPCRLTWKHEADRKRAEPTFYRRCWFRLAEWVHDHRNGHWVTLVPTQTYQWTMGTGSGKGTGDWSKYYTGIGTPGVDVYANSWEAHYPDPELFLAPLWRYRDTVDTALELPEFGAARVKGDADGKGRAEFLWRCAQIMQRESVTAVCYWDDVGSNSTDLRLWTDKPATSEFASWSAVIADNA